MEMTKRLGLGAMGMTDGVYGSSDRAESIATVHAALDAGVTLIDTGDHYGSGHNELLLGEALRGRDRSSYRLSVKFGALRAADGSSFMIDNRPQALKAFLAYSLVRLGTDYVDIYRPARRDPGVPIEDTVGAIKELIDAGLVRQVGLSEVDAETVRRAHAVHPVADLQFEYSLLSRSIEQDILPTLRELGIGLTAYGVLGRGLLSGRWSPEQAAAPGDSRAFSPRFAAENVQHNLRLVAALREVADAKGCTVAQLAIAWVAARGPEIIPLVGARTRTRLAEALREVPLTAADLAEIEKAVPRGSAAGDRAPAAAMSLLVPGS